MTILGVRIYDITIPFTLEVTHGMASRSSCDSLIVAVSTDAGTGYGEALVRDYVSGTLDAATGSDRLPAAAEIVRRLLAPLAGREMRWPETRAWIESVHVEPPALPLLCGIEGALLDSACRAAGTDVYGLLGMSPAAADVVYGGTLPILPPEASKKFLGLFKSFRLPNLRIKLNSDPAYAASVLSLARRIFGDGFDIRVDANASWSYGDAMEVLPLLRKHGVSMIEEPFGRGREENLRFSRDDAARGFALAADESALTPEDVTAIGADGSFRLINIRLAKNGGLLRALRMRAAAIDGGLALQAGCHVGETGILSATGRAAASLMPEAVYVDGSYDGYILAGNVTTENFTFGQEGRAPVLTGRRLGYDVDESKLEEYAHGQCTCF